MSTLAKEFETTCQLPPSTPQQRLTPPTVLLPATFAILPSQSSSNPTAAATLVTGTLAPLALQHAAFAMPLLGHTLASTATATMNLAVSPAPPSPSTVLASHSLYPTIDVQSGSSARESTVSAMAAPTLCTGPVRHRCSGSGSSSGGERVAILLPSLYAPAATPTSAGLRVVPPPRPLHGCPAPLEEDDDCVPLTPASSTDGESTFDPAQLPTHDRAAAAAGGGGGAGPASRTQSRCCSSRSASAAAPPLTAIPTACVQAAQGSGVRHTVTTATVMQSPPPPVTGTPSSSSSAAPSFRSTPPAMPSHLVSALPPYPFWGVDGVCAICPINTCVESTTTTTMAREEQSTSGLAPFSSLSARQRSQQQQQQQRCGTGQRARSRAASRKSALLNRHHATRTHISLQEGPVVMATAPAATSTTTTTSAMTTPIASSAGRLTPASPLFLAPSLCVHSDPTRGLFTPSPAAAASGGSHESHAALSAFDLRRRESYGSVRGGEGEVTSLIALSRPPTPPCSSGGGSGTTTSMPLTSFTGVNGVGAGGVCGGGATDPLSDCPTRSPSLSQQQQQQQQQHRSMRETSPHYVSHSHNAYVHSTSTTAAAAAAPNAALPGQLTFFPIEVQSAPTMAPFFASLGGGGGGGAAGAAVLSPASLNQSHLRGAASGRRGSFHDGGHAVPPMQHLDHTNAGAATAATTVDDVLSRSSSTTAAPSASAFFATATPTRMLASWSASAAPGVVTAILAAPEVSWPSFNIGADHAMTAVGASNSAATSTGQDSGRRGTGGGGGAGSPCAATVSADTQSPATSRSLTRATSPAPWLYRVGDSIVGGGNGSGDGALPHSASLLHGGGGMPAFGNGVQSQLSYSAVPREDTESACVICLEGHARPRDELDDGGESATMWEAALRSSLLSASDSGGVKPGSQLLVMPCKHCCHQNCLQRWLMESTCCPMCRRDLTQDAILPS